MKWGYIVVQLCLVCCSQSKKYFVKNHLSVESSLKRDKIFENSFRLDKNTKVTIGYKLYYNNDVPYQNVFFRIKLYNHDILLESRDTMVMLFDEETGYPLGKHLFSQYIDAGNVFQNFDLQPGEYTITLQQYTRHYALPGLKAIEIYCYET